MLNKAHLFLFISLFISNIAFSQEADKRTTQQIFNQELYNQLPPSILKTKQIIAVNDGHVPPYIIYNENGEMSGATIDMFNAISEILGIKIQHEKTTSVASILMGIESTRYDLAIGPITDSQERQLKNDFIVYAMSYPAIAVPKGNPQNIQSTAELCGKRVAAEAGSQGIDILANYSEVCVTEGNKPLDVMVFKDQVSAVLALRSGRVDAFANSVSMISYFVSHSNGELELTGIPKLGSNIPIRYFSAVVAKNSPLGPVILAAMQELFANGTYAEIMKKWNMEAAMLPATGMNLAK